MLSLDVGDQLPHGMKFQIMIIYIYDVGTYK